MLPKIKKWSKRILIVLIPLFLVAFVVWKFINIGTWPWNLETLHPQTLPKFITYNYIDLERIYEVSKFRSGSGHDNSDSFERCRSMKHYFQMKRDEDRTNVKVFAPTNGKVSLIFPEGEGSQVWIKPEGFPQYNVIMYHVTPIGIGIGSKVSSGQEIGHHASNKTNSDIQISLSNLFQTRMISYFDVMTDGVFEEFKKLGIESREEFIISKETRDADPMKCKGFGTTAPFVQDEDPKKAQVILREQFQGRPPANSKQKVIVTGELVCLPHKNQEGPQTLECAYGLKDEKGDHYALHDPEFKYLMNLAMGTKIVVEGILTAQTDSKYDILGLIQIESIK